MIRRITLENFMSHVHSVIDLDAGLNVLVGPNNCGKSAVVEAIRAVCENTETNFMVRHGAKEATVTIETEDGHTIVWRRRKTYASYTLDGEQNDRPTNDYLRRVHALLRLPMVRTADGSDEFQVHLGLQKSPIFLLNESKLRQATFFASSSDAEKLLEMQRRHRARVADDKKSQSRLSSDIATIDAKLATLQPVDELSADVGRLAVAFEMVRSKAAEIDRATTMIAELKRAGRERERLSEGLERLKDLAAPPALPDELPLARSIQQIKETQRTRDVAESIQSALRSLPTPPALADVDALSATTERLRAASAGKRRAAVVATELQTLQTPPAPADESPLRQMLLRLKQAQGALAQMQRAVSIATDEVAAARQEAIAFITENPKCPLCNGELDVEQLLTARGHEHV